MQPMPPTPSFSLHFSGTTVVPLGEHTYLSTQCWAHFSRPEHLYNTPKWQVQAGKTLTLPFEIHRDGDACQLYGNGLAKALGLPLIEFEATIMTTIGPLGPQDMVPQAALRHVDGAWTRPRLDRVPISGSHMTVTINEFFFTSRHLRGFDQVYVRVAPTEACSMALGTHKTSLLTAESPSFTIRARYRAQTGRA